MNNFLKKYWYKFYKYNHEESKILKKTEEDKQIFQEKFEAQINSIHNKIDSNKPLNLLHSGHAADIVNVLPVIKELSKKHVCNLYIRIDSEDILKNGNDILPVPLNGKLRKIHIVRCFCIGVVLTLNKI